MERHIFGGSGGSGRTCSWTAVLGAHGMVCRCAQLDPGPRAWQGHNPTASRQWNVAPEEAKSIKPRSSQ